MKTTRKLWSCIFVNKKFESKHMHKIYVIWRSNNQEGESCDPNNQFNPVISCASPKPGPGDPSSLCCNFVVLNDLRLDCLFSLKFLFI